MDRQEEYHDPDYPEAPVAATEGAPSAAGDERVEKIRSIVSREFDVELEARENDIKMMNQRSLLARRLLHRLRYVLVHNYYDDEKLKITGGQMQDEVAAQSEPRTRASVTSLLRDGQRRLHPSVRKLLGKQSSAVELNEILFRRRAPRNNARKDYSAMLQSRNYTIAADATRSLRPPTSPEPPAAPAAARPKKMPRKLLPAITNVVTLDEATRNQMKYRYRIIIGNTSKFAPASSSADRSTHKWLLYVRGPPQRPALAPIVTAVTVTLHHSYSPHHTVHLDAPPFHVSRRGWGEFPARVELHFALPERNRPATLQHTIKLDRNYTGFQTLGAETVVDVWLYSTEEMIKYQYTDDIKTEPADESTEPQENHSETTEITTQNEIFQTTNDAEEQTDNWLDFFTNTTELDVDEMIIKPTKKIEETNDLDNLIEGSVISKDSTENLLRTDIHDGNHCAENVQEELFSEIIDRRDINSEIVKKGPLEDIPDELLNQSASPKKRIMKYMDPSTGKIYYLEMDRKLDLTKVQEIVINSKGNVKTAKISPIKSNGLKKVRKAKKGGVSLLKPEIKSLLKSETKSNQTQNQNQTTVLRKSFTHIENDHCYLGPAPVKDTLQIVENLQSYEEVPVKDEKSVLKCICSALKRLSGVKMAVDYCLKKMPIITSDCQDPDYVMSFPYVVASEKRYWKLDFAKRRNIEWSRAKLINKLLLEHLHTSETIWRTKQILIYSRLHGYYPIRTDTVQTSTVNETDWSSWMDMNTARETDTNIKEIYPNVTDITTLSIFNPDDFNQNLSESLDSTESDDEVEIVSWNEPVRIKKELTSECSDLPVLPVTDPQERLRFMYIERKCADIGIELRNEDVGNGYSYSAVHAVLLSAMKSFIDEIIRSALAHKLRTHTHASGSSTASDVTVWRGSSSVSSVSLAHVHSALQSGRAASLSQRHLAAREHHTHHL